MRRYSFGFACLAVTVFGLSALVRADNAGKVEQAKEGGHAVKSEHAPPKYIVTEHENGKETEHRYDLSNEKDQKSLVAALQAGHVEELKKDEPPDLFAPKRWDLGLWSIAIFVILFLILAKFAWKPMLTALHQREENIRGALDQAEKTRRETLDLQGKLQAEMNQAGQKIAGLMDTAHRDAQALREQMIADAKTETQRDRERLHREIDTAKDQALKEIWEQSVSLAAMLSAKVLRRELTEADHRRLLDETLVDLKAAGLSAGKRI